uniref:Leucine-rich repeat-containing N-terminal plant-type domain-containing protein n=1 Tax=Lactuca sativa TaxID=4236 RepID=A0A9R1X059_LACSA|nr:hypothetical protein LSAT_V11C800444470 [Lactuca sativa]
MRNPRGLGLHLIFISIFLVGIKYTCLGVGNTSVVCSEQERLALLNFKGSVRAEIGILSSWVGHDCCQWKGIQCDNLTGTVESLKLGRYYWGGPCHLFLNEVNSSLAELKHLKYLDLSGFYFHGSRIPEFIGSFKQLSYLDLSGSNLSLSFNFVNLINMLPSLSELHLSGCELDNTFLSSSHLNISTLSHIRYLDLSSNSIEGIIPSFFTNMSSLRVLDLSGNMLHSWVPIMPNLLKLDLSYNPFKNIEHLGIWRRCHLKHLIASNNPFEIEMSDSLQNVSECSRYALESLDLSWSLNGTISEALGRLTNLRDLRISYSSLTGPMPKTLGRLRYLKMLDLCNNLLSGPIPASLGRVTYLKMLDLSNNKLSGPIPASLGRLRYLEELDVFSNLLNGTIPVSIGQLAKLRSLHISNNSLQGVVSEAHFSNLLMLKSLDASSNKLTFNFSHEWIPPFQLEDLDLSSCNIPNGFPQWLRNQRKLRALVLSNATISGPLPSWLRKMPVIHFLDLSHNKLSGSLANLPNRGTVRVIGGGATLLLANNIFNESIPRSLCRRTDLDFLDLSRNRLTGKFPKCLENLKLLNTMMFSSNLLSGAIPSYIGLNLSSLRWLKLNDNKFFGELLRELGNLRDLTVLDVGDNELFGSIPKWIGEKLTNLGVLRLHRNNFSGEIPKSLCKMLGLQILDVAHNNLMGFIPHCLGKLNGMVKGPGNLIYNGFADSNENVIQVMKGVEREYTTILDIFFNIDLSSNKLVGEIPVEITTLSMLVGLNLSNNHLSGNIPENIGNMTKLESLDLSGNELTGMIPPSMAALNFLSHLNLSHNNLSGRIPTDHQLQTLIDDPSIYVGNRDLCGPPLPNNCSHHQDQTTVLKKKHKAAEESIKVWWFYMDIMSGFAAGFWGVIGVLLFKKHWRQKLFMFAEEIVDTIYVAVTVRVAKMKRGREAT